MDAFEKIGNQLDTVKYNRAVQDLKEIYEIVYDEDHNVR